MQINFIQLILIYNLMLSFDLPAFLKHFIWEVLWERTIQTLIWLWSKAFGILIPALYHSDLGSVIYNLFKSRFILGRVLLYYIIFFNDIPWLFYMLGMVILRWAIGHLLGKDFLFLIIAPLFWIGVDTPLCCSR